MSVEGVKMLLRDLGQDPESEQFQGTAERVVKAYKEMTSGYGVDPASVLGKKFHTSAGGPITVSPIFFTSLCEHHLLPFSGYAHVGYTPAKLEGSGYSVVGLSKIPQLVEVFARRFQLQETMTQQICDAIRDKLAPRSVVVLVEAHHSCMGCRGVRKHEAIMGTRADYGYGETCDKMIQMFRRKT